jgi:hypothetical protein
MSLRKAPAGRSGFQARVAPDQGIVTGLSEDQHNHNPRANLRLDAKDEHQLRNSRANKVILVLKDIWYVLRLELICRSNARRCDRCSPSRPTLAFAITSPNL